MKLEFIDVKRAYLQACVRREVYVELPEEDQEPGKDLVGKLRLALYGTRETAAAWQNHSNGNSLAPS